MSRQQWGWIVAIGLSLLFVLVTGKYAYDTNALGTRTPGLVSAAAWAVAVLVALANLLGLFGAIRDTSKSYAIRIINSLAGRSTILALSAVLGALFLIAALGAESRTWVCNIESRTVMAPDRSRCADDSAARMRSFRLRLQRTSLHDELPTLGARVLDRTASSVAIDSDRGGLCVADGPDYPTRGESRLDLSPDCGADQRYIVNLHLCDSKVIESTSDRAAELGAAVRLEIREGHHANAIVCE